MLNIMSTKPVYSNFSVLEGKGKVSFCKSHSEL